MVYLNRRKSASQLLCLLGRLGQRAHSLDGPLNGGACGNLAVPGVGRPVDIDAGELASLQPAEVDDVLDREVVTSGVLTFYCHYPHR